MDVEGTEGGEEDFHGGIVASPGRHGERKLMLYGGFFGPQLQGCHGADPFPCFSEFCVAGSMNTLWGCINKNLHNKLFP
jgi:hypothetical protein